MEKLIISSSPYIKDKVTVAKLMWGIIISLLPAAGYSVYLFRLRAVELILVCCFFSMLSEYLFLRLRKKEISREPSALVSGLLLAMLLPPNFPLWAAALGAIFAIIIAKQIFGGLGYNIFNPALVGRAFLMATYPVLMTSWIEPFTLNAVTTATPLGLIKFESQSTPILQLFLGNVSGSLGETSALALLVGATYLLIRRYIDWRVPLSYLGTVAIFSEIAYLTHLSSGSLLLHLFAGGLILGAFFMATDPVTTPLSKSGRVIFGIGAGIMVMVIRLWGDLPGGVMFSILFMNALVPLLNHYIKPRVLGSK